MKMSATLPLFAFVLALLAGTVPAALAQLAPTLKKRPIVAVFTARDKTTKLTPEQLRQLTDYLATKMAQGGVFQIIPTSALQRRLRGQKKESYKNCYDTHCQIEIGRELAAQKTLATTVISVGKACAVMTTLYDLRRATSEASASVKSTCSVGGLIGAMDTVSVAIKKQVRSVASLARGTLFIASEPPGAKVYVDGKLMPGLTPVAVPNLRAGKRWVLLVKGDARYMGQADVRDRKTRILKLALEMSAEGKRRLAQSTAARQARKRALARRLRRTRASRRSRAIWAYTLIGVATAAAVGVGVLYGTGFPARSDAHSKYKLANTQADMDTHWADVEGADTRIFVGHILAGVTVAAIGAASYAWLTRPEVMTQGGKRRMASRSTMITLDVGGPDGRAVVVVGGRF